MLSTMRRWAASRPEGGLDGAEGMVAVAVLAGLVPLLLIRLLGRLADSAAHGGGAWALAGAVTAVAGLVRATGLAILGLLALYCAARVGLWLVAGARGEGSARADAFLYACAVGVALVGALVLR